MICSFEGCKRDVWCKELCRPHYSQWKREGVLRPIGGSYKNKGPCIINSCSKVSYCKEMCTKHYMRFKRHGDPLVSYTRKYKDKTLTMMSQSKCYKINSDDKFYLNTLLKGKMDENGWFIE